MTMAVLGLASSSTTTTLKQANRLVDQVRSICSLHFSLWTHQHVQPQRPAFQAMEGQQPMILSCSAHSLMNLRAPSLMHCSACVCMILSCEAVKVHMPCPLNVPGWMPWSLVRATPAQRSCRDVMRVWTPCSPLVAII